MGTWYLVLVRSTTTLSSTISFTISSTMSSKLLLILVLLVVVAAVNANFYKTKRGRKHKPSKTNDVASEEDCKDLCGDNHAYYSFREKTNLCILFKENSVKMNNKGKPKTIKHYFGYSNGEC